MTAPSVDDQLAQLESALAEMASALDSARIAAASAHRLLAFRDKADAMTRTPSKPSRPILGVQPEEASDDS